MARCWCGTSKRSSERSSTSRRSIFILLSLEQKQVQEHIYERQVIARLVDILRLTDLLVRTVSVSSSMLD